MAGYDKTKPSRNDSYISVLDDVRAKDDALAVMFNGVVLTDVPVNAVNFNGGVFGLWDGSSFVTQAVTISGGGTGATTAAGARANLGVTSSTDLAAGYLSKAGNFSGLTDKPAARTELDVYGKTETYTKTEVNNRTPDATTAVKGLVKLNNTLTSTSTTLALTAAQGKVLNDAIAAANGIIETLSNEIPYYNSTTLGGSGELTGGSCKVVRIGSMITISGYFTHSADTTPESAAGYIPSWARPYSPITGPTSAGNVYFTSPDKRLIVQPDGTMSFVYSSTSTATSGFTITYSGDQ